VKSDGRSVFQQLFCFSFGGREASEVSVNHHLNTKQNISEKYRDILKK